MRYGAASQGKSHARKFTAAIAMPTPKRTPARTLLDPPSPKANVRPDTTMATSDNPRAMVLVNACCRTPTAFSQGEVPVCAKRGTASTRIKRNATASRNLFLKALDLSQRVFILRWSPFAARSEVLVRSSRRIVSQNTELRTRRLIRLPGHLPRRRRQDTLGALAPSRGCLPSRPTRRLSAVRYAWPVTVVDGDHQAQGEIQRELPSYT